MPRTSNKAPVSGKHDRPFQEVRHRNIRATIWKNRTSKGDMYNVTVSRSYKDERGKWHDSDSFAYGDLRNVANALHDAHSVLATAITHTRRKNATENRDDGGDVA
jgi:hypothetical protein